LSARAARCTISVAPAARSPAENGGAGGYGDGTFGPEQNVTREQLAAMIHRLLAAATDK